MPVHPPIVTFDLDGVLCRPPFGINPGTGRGKHRDSPGKRSFLWLTEGWRYAFRKPMPGAVEGFKAIAAVAGVCVVSARSEHTRALTEAWFKRYFGLVPELHLRPSWRETSAQFKARRVPELGAVVHFEDDPFTAQWVADLGPRVFVVDWPRNRWLPADPNIVRITSVIEALSSITFGPSSGAAGSGELADEGPA